MTLHATRMERSLTLVASNIALKLTNARTSSTLRIAPALRVRSSTVALAALQERDTGTCPKPVCPRAIGVSVELTYRNQKEESCPSTYVCNEVCQVERARNPLPPKCRRCTPSSAPGGRNSRRTSSTWEEDSELEGSSPWSRLRTGRL